MTIFPKTKLNRTEKSSQTFNLSKSTTSMGDSLTAWEKAGQLKVYDDFFVSLLSPRAQSMARFASQQRGYFSLATIIGIGLKTPIPPLNKLKRHPAQLLRYIKYFLKIGFLKADPQLGLIYNDNFPTIWQNQ